MNDITSPLLPSRHGSPSLRFLVTGAAGFVGGTLIQRVRRAGYQVRAAVRTSDQADELIRAGFTDVVVCDITDSIALRSAAKDVEGIFHIAALFRRASLPDAEFRRVNVEGVRAVFDAAIAEGVPRIIHCSTVGVHGDVECPPATENSPFSPGDIYQETKLEGERLAREYFNSGKVRGVVIRPAMVYGPGDTRTLKLFSFIARKRFFYVGRGDKLVHFIDVRDLADAFLSAMERKEITDDVFIIAGKRALPLREMVNEVSKLVGVRPPFVHLPVIPMQILGTVVEKLCTPLGISPPIFRRRVDFYTKNRSFNTDHAAELLEFEAKSDVVEELRQIVAWYEEAGMLPRRSEKAPSTPSAPTNIVRSLNGTIREWDDMSHALYGWRRCEALGSTSHGLLRAEFPASLSEINQSLCTQGRWTGRLLHTRRDGKELAIESHWELKFDARGGEPMVHERNLAV